MAEGNPVEHLTEKTKCAICLDYYTDPVTMRCGHNVCRPCLTRCRAGVASNFPCPKCRKKSPKRALSSMQEMAGIVAMAKAFEQHPVLYRGANGEISWIGGKEERPGCVVSSESREHRSHEVVPVEEAALEHKGKLIP